MSDSSNRHTYSTFAPAPPPPRPLGGPWRQLGTGPGMAAEEGVAARGEAPDPLELVVQRRSTQCSGGDQSTPPTPPVSHRGRGLFRRARTPSPPPDTPPPPPTAHNLHSPVVTFQFIDSFIAPEHYRDVMQTIFQTPSVIPYQSCMALIAVLALVAVVLLGHLFGFHVMLFFKGQSTYEWIISRRNRKSTNQTHPLEPNAECTDPQEDGGNGWVRTNVQASEGSEAKTPGEEGPSEHGTRSGSFSSRVSSPRSGCSKRSGVSNHSTTPRKGCAWGCVFCGGAGVRAHTRVCVCCAAGGVGGGRWLDNSAGRAPPAGRLAQALHRTRSLPGGQGLRARQSWLSQPTDPPPPPKRAL